MKNAKWMMVLVLTGLVGVVCGCSKASPPAQEQGTPKIYGTEVDMPKLQAALEKSADPEVKKSAETVSSQFRARNYTTLMAELNKLANNPNVTEDQKQLISTVTNQLQQALGRRLR